MQPWPELTDRLAVKLDRRRGRPIMSRLLSVILAIGFAALIGCGEDSGSTANGSGWVPDGQWVRDRQGRVLLLRGINYSGLEWGNFSTQPHGPQEADLARIASWGITVVRLPIAWAYLEPEPGRIDLGYLKNEVDRVVDFAQRHGIVVILDMHQYKWSMCFTDGLGIPTWTCQGKYSNTFGAMLKAQSDFWRGATAPDGRPLLDHFADVWLRVAEYYRDSPTVVAFNFFNEPLDVLVGLNEGKPLEQAVQEFEHDVLFPYYQRLARLVRGVGAPQTLVLDPAVTRAVGIRAHPQPIGDTNVMYAPHLYFGADTGGFTGDLDYLRAQYAQAVTEASEIGAPLWIGEWGGVAGGPGFYRSSLAMQDAFLLGSAAWGYFPSGNELVDADGTEHLELVNLLARPYPLQTAGFRNR
jgi:hypothetical protein